MTKVIRNKILKTATFVSGLVGLANADLTKAPTTLAKEKWDDALIVEETNKGTKLSLGIIVDAEVRTKVITYEITSSLKDVMKKSGIKLDKINIFIRGAK